MKSISSAEFRKTYPRLEVPVVVTVNGHPIGTWLPGDPKDIVMSVVNGQDVPVTRREYTAKAQQAERDAILRKINR